MFSPSWEWKMIDPNIAREYLATGDNRRLDNEKVKRYARDMQEGKWVKSGIPAPLEIDEGGRLLDGYHRLNALIMANVALLFLVMHYAAQE